MLKAYIQSNIIQIFQYNIEHDSITINLEEHTETYVVRYCWGGSIKKRTFSVLVKNVMCVYFKF